MITNVLNIQTGKRELMELTPLPATEGQTILRALIKGWHGMVAELELATPEGGWVIFPN